ncbi:hypothetical protein H9634_12520 [Brevibacterium sp. Re57]|uniref:MFS transporter n=1 Tax=Brevibacterium gallinarum TaxID=2762220 RepID=A0ABR8WWY8_9MICO|nr:MFS transporter [Brevibacterium gallinarum]MBD8021604.1 hypothetical protein [Brevibacterium gallinarum]
MWRLVGPGAAGQLARIMAVPLMPIIGVVSVVVAAVLAALLPPDPPRPPKAERDRFWQSVRAGLSFIWHHATIRKLLSAAALNNLAVGFYGAVIATFILRELSINAAAYGVLMSLGAIGGIVSSFVSHRIGKTLGPLRTVFIAACMIPIGLGVLPLASYFPSPTIAVGASELIFSFAVVLYTVQTTGINARLIPVDLMARVTSARRTVSLGSATLGALIGAVLAGFAPLTVPCGLRWDCPSCSCCRCCAPARRVGQTLSPLRRLHPLTDRPRATGQGTWQMALSSSSLLLPPSG